MSKRWSVLGGVVALAILLPGCGGGGGKGPSTTFTPGGASTPTAAASSTPSGPPAPRITLPSGFTVTFEPPASQGGTPEKQAILRDNEILVKSIWQAVGRGKPTDPLYQQYASGSAAIGLKAYIADFQRRKVTVTGSDRIYDRKVILSSPGQASVTWCEDQSKAYAVERATGKVRVTKPSRQDFAAYAARMKATSSGLWMTELLFSKKGDPTCV
jgi:hypothetical protein